MFCLAGLLTYLLLFLLGVALGSEGIGISVLMMYLTPVCFLLCWAVAGRHSGSKAAYGFAMAQGALAAPLMAWAAMRFFNSSMTKIDVAILFSTPWILGYSFWGIKLLFRGRPDWVLWGKRFVAGVGCLVVLLTVGDNVLSHTFNRMSFFYESFALFGAYNGYFAARSRA